MSDNSIIPRSIAGFDTYIVKTNAYLISGTPTNAVRFNWTAANLAAWQGFKTQWMPLHLQYADKQGQRTTAVTEQLHIIIANAVAYAKTNRLIELVKATLTLNSLDCETFNLPVSHAVPAGGGIHTITQAAAAARSLPTADLVYPTLKPVGGGVVRCKCFTEAARSGRPHKLSGFDLIEYRYTVIALGTAAAPAAIPTDPSDTALTIGQSSKANFLLPTGTNNTGKLLCIFFRWVNSKHPALNGPESTCFTTPIL
jgi:hypothetical protein